MTASLTPFDRASPHGEDQAVGPGGGAPLGADHHVPLLLPGALQGGNPGHEGGLGGAHTGS